MAKFSTCKNCKGKLRWVDVRDPYWQHVNAKDLGPPHATEPQDKDVR